MKKEYTGKNGSHTTIEIRRTTPKEAISSALALIAIGVVVWWFVK